MDELVRLIIRAIPRLIVSDLSNKRFGNNRWQLPNVMDKVDPRLLTCLYNCKEEKNNQMLNE